MRILTLSINAWNDTLATGNTFSNFFSNRSEDDVFANIYCRKETIDNKVCNEYFQITEKDILLSAMKLTSSGRCFSFTDVPEEEYGDQSILAVNNSRGDFLRRKRPASLLLLREFIWCIPSWRGKKLNRFLTEFNPDVIYMHAHGVWYMHKLLWYCKKCTGAKIVLFSGDDIWSYQRKGLLYYFYHSVLREHLRYSFTHADLVCGGSPQLCDEFGKLFSRDIKPLYKSCSRLSTPRIKVRSFPLILVYCGNLLYGRSEILCDLAKQIRVVNQEGKFVQLRIYSNTPLNEDQSILLNDGNHCVFEGAKQYDDIVRVLDECDFSLFVESFEPEYVKITRLSFSTKIIDYLQASSALLAVGPSSIASVDYLKRSNVAIMVDKPEQFARVLNQFISNTSLINEWINRKYEYALKYHSESSLLHMMKTYL